MPWRRRRRAIGRAGSTEAGPHRAEVVLRLDERRVQDEASRGQQKLTAAALILAQVAVESADRPLRSVLVVDDPAAELDAGSLERLLAALADLPAQLIFTALTPGAPSAGARPPSVPRGTRGSPHAIMAHPLLEIGEDDADERDGRCVAVRRSRAPRRFRARRSRRSRCTTWKRIPIIQRWGRRYDADVLRTLMSMAPDRARAARRRRAAPPTGRSGSSSSCKARRTAARVTACARRKAARAPTRASS